MGLSTRQLLFTLILGLAGCRAKAKAAASIPVVTSNGTRYVQLDFIARLYSMKMTSVGSKIRLQNKWNTIDIETTGRRCWVNGTMIWMHHPCAKVGTQRAIREVDFKKLIDPMMRAYAYVPAKSPKVVVLDAGHGGKDSGTIGARRAHEKLVVMDVTKRVEAHLKGKGLVVKLTRSTDTYLTLQQRCDVAAKQKADLFVSIHADGVTDPQANGTGVFILSAGGNHSTNDYGSNKGNVTAVAANQHDAANAILGYSIQSNLIKMWKRSDRGLRRARYYVLRNAPCPAALVECAFLSNPTEEGLMIEAKNRDIVAKGIANGILGYVTQVNRVQK